MTKTRDIILGGRTFAIPALPLNATIKVYPICRKLTRDGLMARSVALGGVLDASEEEMVDVVEVAFLCAQAADSSLRREEFEALPITPPELLDAFLIARYQTGAWLVPGENVTEDGVGEAQGEASPQKLTSTESSPASSATSTSRKNTG